MLLLAILAGWAGLAGAGDAELSVSSDLLRQAPAAREKAIQARLAATPVSWPAGRRTLGEAVAALAATGNATGLGPGVDASLAGDLAAQSGDYWQGVLAVCTAFDLVLQPGEAMDQSEDSGRYGNRDNAGSPLIAQGGAVVFIRHPDKAPHPIYLSSGVMLAEVATLELRQRRGSQPSRSLDAALELRFEPHVLPGQVGTTLVSWSAAEDASGRKLELAEAAPARASVGTAIRITKVPERFTGLQLNGELAAQLLEPVDLGCVLKTGMGARTELLGQAVELRLLGDGDSTVGGQKGPGLSVSVPTTVLGARPHVQVMSAGNLLPFSLQGSQWSGGRMELFFRGPKLGDGDYSVSIKGQAALQQPHLPLHLVLAFDHLPDGEAATSQGFELQIPTHLSWSAGHLAVRDAVKLLAANGNQALLELGVEESRASDLPAFSGTFWEGVLALCRAYDLAIVPPSRPLGDGDQPVEVDENGETLPMTSCIAGGQLVLGAKRAGRRDTDAYQACGILLMGVEDLSVTTRQTLGGISRQADISFRLRLEPRFDAGLIGSASVAWTTLAGQSDGRALVVDDAAAADTDEDQRQRVRRRMRFVRMGRRIVQVPVPGAEQGQGEQSNAGAVAVTGLPAGPVTLSVGGQATLALRREVRAEVTLSPGGHGVAQLGGHALAVRLFANGGGEDATGRSGVSIDQGGETVDSLNVEVRNASGKNLRNSDTSTNTRNGRPRSLWYFPDLESGDYTVIITAKEHLATLRLPFTLTTTTP